MDRRPQGLAPIDRLSVPLPHGTEVTTRVERVVGERRIPQGVVGRVVAIHDSGFDILVTGFGVVQYGREELLPRRPGQVRFAERRAADWEVLRPCVVLEATVGSARGGSPTTAPTPICAASSRSRSSGPPGSSRRRTR